MTPPDGNPFTGPVLNGADFIDPDLIDPDLKWEKPRLLDIEPRLIDEPMLRLDMPPERPPPPFPPFPPA